MPEEKEPYVVKLEDYEKGKRATIKIDGKTIEITKVPDDEVNSLWRNKDLYMVGGGGWQLSEANGPAKVGLALYRLMIIFGLPRYNARPGYNDVEWEYYFRYKGHMFSVGDIDYAGVMANPFFWGPREEMLKLVRENKGKEVLAPYEIEKEFVEAMEKLVTSKVEVMSGEGRSEV